MGAFLQCYSVCPWGKNVHAFLLQTLLTIYSYPDVLQHACQGLENGSREKREVSTREGGAQGLMKSLKALSIYAYVQSHDVYPDSSYENVRVSETTRDTKAPVEGS